MSSTHNHIKMLVLFHSFAKYIFIKQPLWERHGLVWYRKSSGHGELQLLS